MNQRVKNLASSITSFRNLKKAIESPLDEPSGNNAIITYSEEVEKAQISIAVDTLVKGPQYMKIQSTPVTHTPGKKTGEINELVKSN